MNISEAATYKGVKEKTIQKKLQLAGVKTSSTMQLTQEHKNILGIVNGHSLTEYPPVVAAQKKWELPSGWDLVNYFEMILIAWELWMIWGVESLVVTALFFCFIYSSQRIAKNPKLKESQTIAFYVVGLFSIISACLHTYFFEEAMTIKEWEQWMRTTVAVSMAIIVSGMSFFAVFITHKVQNEQ